MIQQRKIGPRFSPINRRRFNRPEENWSTLGSLGSAGASRKTKLTPAQKLIQSQKIKESREKVVKQVQSPKPGAHPADSVIVTFYKQSHKNFKTMNDFFRECTDWVKQNPELKYKPGMAVLEYRTRAMNGKEGWLPDFKRRVNKVPEKNLSTNTIQEKKIIAKVPRTNSATHPVVQEHIAKLNPAFAINEKMIPFERIRQSKMWGLGNAVLVEEIFKQATSTQPNASVMQEALFIICKQSPSKSRAKALAKLDQVINKYGLKYLPV